MLALSVVAAACAKKVEVVVKDGYQEPVNLYVAVALPPGSRKSAVLDKVTEPIRSHEAAEAERLRPVAARADTVVKVQQIRLKFLLRDAAQAGPEQEARLIDQATALAVEIEEAEKPVVPTLIVADVTPERLATLLHHNAGRMAVMSPEGDVFDMMAGRYGKTGANCFAVYLRGHAGDDLRVDRVSRKRNTCEGRR